MGVGLGSTDGAFEGVDKNEGTWLGVPNPSDGADDGASDFLLLFVDEEDFDFLLFPIFCLFFSLFELFIIILFAGNRRSDER